MLNEVGLKIINKKVGKLIEYNVEGKIKRNSLDKIYYESYYLLLDINAKGIDFKCKKKLPKITLGEGDVKLNPAFFSLKLDEMYFDEFKKEFLFDIPNAKKIDISHTIVVDDIIIPKELEKSNDYEKIRQEALKKGKIIRNINADGKKMIKEYEFKV